MREFLSLFLAAILVLVAIVSAETTSDAIVLYVARSGNDSWSGRYAEPDPAHKDGPYATIGRAQQEIRRIKSSGQLTKPITVLIRQGTYFLSEPLLFGPEDSGTADYPITFQAYAGENPVISGGKSISGWKKKANNLWYVDLPEVKKSEWYFRQLFVNGKRRFRARTPNQGFYRIAENPGLDPKAPYNTPAKLFRYAPGDIDPNWTNLTDVEVVVLHFWVDTHLPIASVNADSHLVRFTRSSRRRLTDDFNKQGARYYVDNVFEAMDEAGEWYLNRQSGRLYYLAKEGEDMKKAQVFAPLLSQLVRMQGDPAAGQYVQHIRFSGLTFSHNEWTLPPDDAGDLQAANTVPGAIYAIGARDILIKNCTLAHLGTYGIQFADGCRNIKVEENTIADLGAGGIRLSGGDASSDSSLRTGHITLANNHIHHLGQIYHSAVGVLLQHADNNLIAHNHIHHLYYTGVSVGWVWGYKPSVSINNRIEYNHIHDVGQNLLSDMGGIYLLGVSPGTVVSNNLIHDVYSWGYGGWGIYTDEGSTDILIENNVVHHTKSAGFHQHYGKENIIRNNVFAFGQQAQIMRTRMEKHLSFTFERNVVYWRNADLLGSNWKDDQYRLDYNLYFRTDGKPVTFKQWTFEQWQARGQDVHSVIADPLFVDVKHADFALQPESPAFKLGIKQFDMTTVGARLWPEEVTEITYTSTADGSRQPALFYNSATTQAKPLLVALHTWSGTYLQKDSVPYANWCIQKDWVLIHPNFRGANKKPEACGSALVVQDILDAVNYARQHANIDTSRIYLVGVSGGGYASLLMAAKAPQLWAAVSAWVPISDLKEWYFQSVALKTRYADHIVAACGGTPDANKAVRAEYFNRSPIHFLQNARTVPLDINAGIHDGHTGSVPISQTLRAFNVLAAEQDRLSEQEISSFVEKEKVPQSLSGDYFDAFYGDRKVLFRRQSGLARVTIFEGGHEIIFNAALHWLEKQQK